MSVSGVLQFLLCTAGIYASYLIQGTTQEALSTEAFGPSGERFKGLAILAWVQGLGCLAVSFALRLAFRRQTGDKQYAPLLSYWSVGFSAAVGPSLGYNSLRNINYSAQVIVKSCKLIPTMVMGVVLYGVRYRSSEWTVVAILCAGLSLFSWKSSSKATAKLSSPNLLLGYLCCVLNLFCDGYTNTCQDNINRKSANLSVIYMMFATNFWLSIWSTALLWALELLGLQSVVSEFVHFFMSYGLFRLQILVFCLCGAIGQLFIFWMITAHGSLVNVLVTTTRKFLSILLSVFWSGTPLLLQQWIGVAFVFIGILGNILLKNRSHKDTPTTSIKSQGKNPRSNQSKRNGRLIM